MAFFIHFWLLAHQFDGSSKLKSDLCLGVAYGVIVHSSRIPPLAAYSLAVGTEECEGSLNGGESGFRLLTSSTSKFSMRVGSLKGIFLVQQP